MLPRDLRKVQWLNGLLGTICKVLRALLVDKRYIDALFNFNLISFHLFALFSFFILKTHVFWSNAYLISNIIHCHAQLPCVLNTSYINKLVFLFPRCPCGYVHASLPRL